MSRELTIIRDKIRRASLGYQAQVWEDRGIFEIHNIKDSDLYLIEGNLRSIDEIINFSHTSRLDFSKPYFGAPNQIHTIRGMFEVSPEQNTLEENSNRYRRLKRGLFGDDSGKIRTFAIISAENPLGWKNSTEDEFKDKFAKWVSDKVYYNKDRIKEIESTVLLHKIENTGDEGVKYGGFTYVPLKGKYGDLERSYIIFNLTLSDAKIIARDYGQESFFFAKVFNDKSQIAYYVTYDNCKTYNKVEVSETISDETDAEDFFSKFGLKFRINMREFGDEVPIVRDEVAFDESFDEENRNFISRARMRKQSYRTIE